MSILTQAVSSILLCDFVARQARIHTVAVGPRANMSIVTLAVSYIFLYDFVARGQRFTLPRGSSQTRRIRSCLLFSDRVYDHGITVKLVFKL